MLRMIQRIRTSHGLRRHFAKELQYKSSHTGELRHSFWRMVDGADVVHIIADNVEQFYAESAREEWNIMDEKTFPNIAPPFPQMFIECVNSEFEKYKMVSGDTEINANRAIWQVGAFFDSTSDKKNIVEFADWMASVYSDMRSRNKEFASRLDKEKCDHEVDCFRRAKWLIRAVPWVLDKSGEPNCANGTRYMAVDETGKCLAVYTQWDTFIGEQLLKAGMELDDYLGIISGLLHVPLLTLCFMHCKNVEISDVPRSEVETAKWCRRQKVAEVQYKVLEIDPVRKVLRSEGGLGSGEVLSRSLHICRGHFAHYTEEHPLFGKHTGTFWRPSHVRGSQKIGIVEKEYSVNPERT